MVSFAIQYRATVLSRPRKRRSSTPLFAAVAVLAALGAAAAGVMHARNSARAARFQNDPLCQEPLVAPTSAIAAACRVDVAQIADRSIGWRSKSRVFNVTLRTGDGFVDFVELEGASARRLWDAMPVGTSALVQRFTESNRWHITVVRSHGLVARTEWNPAWRANDALTGVVFLSAVAVAALIAFIVAHAKERRDASRQPSFDTVREY